MVIPINTIFSSNTPNFMSLDIIHFYIVPDLSNGIMYNQIVLLHEVHDFEQPSDQKINKVHKKGVIFRMTPFRKY